jgi:hypothetical protein
MAFPVFVSRTIIFISLFLSTVGTASAGVLRYSGTVTYDGVVPVANGFVIAGTFKSTFSPYSYKYAYGVDGDGNMDSPRLSQAIADGNFIPIGPGVVTSANGLFSGAGISDTPPGEPIYLFAFNHPTPDLADHFALGTAPTWVTETATFINGADASSFVFGTNLNSTITLQVLPTPEPSAVGMLAVGLVAIAGRRCWRRSAA